MIDDHLNFKGKIAALGQEVGAKLSTFYRVKGQVTTTAKRTFYLSFIQSNLEYGSTAYVHCLHAAQHNVLVKLSKRALRVVFHPRDVHTAPILARDVHTAPILARDVHTAPILARLSLIPVSSRYNLKLYTFVLRCTTGQVSSLLSGIFTLRSTITGPQLQQTRFQCTNGLVVPRAISRYGRVALSYLAADRWNSAHRLFFVPLFLTLLFTKLYSIT